MKLNKNLKDEIVELLSLKVGRIREERNRKHETDNESHDLDALKDYVVAYYSGFNEYDILNSAAYLKERLDDMIFICPKLKAYEEVLLEILNHKSVEERK